MRRLVLKMSVSVDGFVGGPNGEIDWLFQSMDSGAASWTADTLWASGLHIMGSRTFYDMAAWWPKSTEPFAAPMNQIPKAVFTSTGRIETSHVQQTTTALRDATRANGAALRVAEVEGAASWLDPQVVSGDLVEALERLKRQDGKDILAHGGASFAQSLARTGLIDEYRLLVHPVALGAGLPLFKNMPRPIDLKLQSCVWFASGAVGQVYLPA